MTPSNAVILIAVLLGFAIATFSGDWLELAMWAIRQRHKALWVSLRYQQSLGVTFWAVAIQPLNGGERLIASSSIRALAVFRALLQEASRD